MVSDLEKKFFDTYNLQKPMIKRWSYEGYYEDFSWESSYEDCSKFLKLEGISLEQLNDRIQTKKEEEKQLKDGSYNRETDSVRTLEFGRVSGAYYDYPSITDKSLLKLICVLHNNPVITLVSRDIKTLKEEVLNIFITRKDNRLFRKEVKKVFKNAY